MTAAVSPRLTIMVTSVAVASILSGAWDLRSTTTATPQSRRQLCACPSYVTSPFSELTESTSVGVTGLGPYGLPAQVAHCSRKYPIDHPGPLATGTYAA